MSSNNYKFYLRLLTGAISSTDTDNEWSKYIINSDLNSTITPSDNNIWNWSGIASLTSTTPANNAANRVIQGNATASTFSSAASNTANTTTGFRPVLIIENVNVVKPNPPTGITVTNLIYNSATLTWDEVTNATSYNIYNLDGSLLANTTDVSYALSNLTANTPYGYFITALASGEESSKASISFLTPQDPTPNIPTNIQVTSITSNSVTITWDEDDKALSYNIWDSNNLLYANVLTPTYTFIDLSENTSYEFTISGVGDLSTESSKSLPFTILTKPTNVTNLNLNDSAVLSWTAGTGTETLQYNIYVNDVLYDSTTSLTYSLPSSLIPYYLNKYSVTAENTSGESGKEDIYVPIVTPTNLSVLYSGFNVIYSWDANITGIYRLYSGETLIAETTETTYTEVNSSEVSKDVVVRSYSSSQLEESSDSNTVTVLTLPNHPTDLEITVIPTGFTLTWSDNSVHEVGYKIYKRVDGSSWELIGTINDTSFTDVFVYDGGVLYEYQVCAYNITGDSSYIVSGIKLLDSVTVSGLVEDSLNKITYTWDVSNGADSYDVHVTTNGVTSVHEVFTNSYIYTITGEVSQSVYVVAKDAYTYGDAISSDSNIVNLFSSPRNIITDLHCTPIRNGDNYDIYVTFSDNSIVEDGFRIAYSFDGQSYQTVDLVSTTKGTIGTSYNKTISIPILTSNKVNVKVASYNIFGVSEYCEPFVIVAPPTDFTVGWHSYGIAEYSWTDNTDIEVEYEFVYSINGGEEQTIIVPSTSTGTTGSEYSVTVELSNHLDLISARVRAYTLQEEYGFFSNYVEEMYFEINNPIPPPNFVKIKTVDGVKLQWDSLDYVDYYEITYTVNDITSVATTVYSYYDIEIDYENITSFSASIRTFYIGGKISESSETISFIPTITYNQIGVDIYNTTSVEYMLNQSSMNENVTNVFDLSTFTKTLNIESIISGFETSIIAYGVLKEFYWDSYIFYKITEEYNNILIIKNVLNNGFYVSQNTITEDIEKTFLLSTNSFQKDLITFSEPLIQVIKNQGVQNIAPVSFVVWSNNLLQNAYDLVVISCTLMNNEIEPVNYTIFTKLVSEIFIVTDIHKIRICTLGDSITAGHPGYWAESGTGRVTSQYQYWLQKRLKTDFEVLNNGYGSDTTLRCLNRFNRDIVANTPQYVIIQAGTNDIHWALAERKDDQDYLNAKMEQAKENLITMVDLAIANNIVPILGTLIPRTSAQGIYRTALFDYNTWIINYCNSRDDVYYVDFYNAGKDNIPPTPLEEPGIAGNLNPLYDGDSKFDDYGNLIRRGQGVHPNDAGYRLMAEAVPLSLFSSLISGIQIYLDKECTVEEESIVSADTTKVYNITFKNLNRGRVKTTTRYLKNIGNDPVLYSLYATKKIGLDIEFSADEINYKNNLYGSIASGGIQKIEIRLSIPQYGEVPNVELNVATRSIKTV